MGSYLEIVFVVDEVKMRSLGRVLIPYDRCPYKTKKLGQTCSQGGHHVKVEGGVMVLPA